MSEQKEKGIEKREKGRLSRMPEGTLIPPVDIYEDEDKVVLFADLPGVGKDGLDVHVDKDTLHITGKLKDITKGDAQYSEIPAKDYYRAFTIGDEINRDKINAFMSNGVLKLELQKTERAKPKKIDITFS